MEKLLILKCLKYLRTKPYYLIFMIHSLYFTDVLSQNVEKKIMVYIDKSLEFENDSTVFNILGLYAGILEQLNLYANKNCDFILDADSAVEINDYYYYYEKRITDFFSMDNCFDSVPMLFFANNLNSRCSGKNFKIWKGDSLLVETNYSVKEIINLINGSLLSETIVNINEDFYSIMSNFYVEYKVNDMNVRNVDSYLLIFSGNKEYWCNRRRIALLRRLGVPSSASMKEAHVGSLKIKLCFENNSEGKLYECKLIGDYEK